MMERFSSTSRDENIPAPLTPSSSWASSASASLLEGSGLVRARRSVKSSSAAMGCAMPFRGIATMVSAAAI